MHMGEIRDLSDPRLAQVRGIYDEAFPEDGEDGWAWLMQRMAGADNAPGVTPTAYHLLVAEEDGQVSGFMALAFWLADGEDAVRLGFADYLGVASGLRGRGIGAKLYRAALARLSKDAAAAGVSLSGMAFDVEDPDLAPTPENRRLRQRRIGFYQRLGARLTHDVDFWEPARAGEPPVRYRLFYHVGARDFSPRELVRLLYRLIYGWTEEHPLVRAALRIDTRN